MIRIRHGVLASHLGVSRSALWVFSLVVLAVLAQTLPAAADDEIAKPVSAEARDRLAAGTRLYRVREFEKATEEYKAGAIKEDAPVFYYNLGQCYRQLGRYQDAIWHYQRFLDRANPLPAKYRQAVEGFIRDMKAELDKKAMTKQPTEPAPDSRPPPNTPPVTEPLPGIVTMEDRAEPWYVDGLGWGLTGTGVVASGVSLWLLLDAAGLADDANHESSQEKQAALRNRAGDRRLAGTIVGVVGAAALLTGIVKLAIAPKDRPRTVTATDLSLGVTGTGFVVTGRF